MSNYIVKQTIQRRGNRTTTRTWYKDGSTSTKVEQDKQPQHTASV